MTTEDHQTIDFVALDRSDGSVILVLVEDRPWRDVGELLPDLQEKLNVYLNYVTSGQLISAYPETSTASVKIELRSAYPPGEREKKFLDIVVRNHFRPAGIDFSWRVL